MIRTEGNQQVTALQVSVGQVQAEFLIPLGSRLPSAVKLDPNLPDFRFDKYKAINGIMMPSKMAGAPNAGLYKVRYEIDPKYDPKFHSAEPTHSSLLYEESEPWRPGRNLYYRVPPAYR